MSLGVHLAQGAPALVSPSIDSGASSHDGTSDVNSIRDSVGALEVLLICVVALLLLVPVFWQPHVQAGDLSSHLYNAWLAGQVAKGEIPGLVLTSPHTNVLADWALAALMKSVGRHWTERIVVSVAVELFFWGAFCFVTVASGSRAWLVAPFLSMLSYGLIFEFGFLNFYIATALSLWIMALLWHLTWKRLAFSIPLAVLVLLAHVLPLAWAVAALFYLYLARRISAHRRIFLLIGGACILIASQVALSFLVPTQWSLALLMNGQALVEAVGVEQFWIYGFKYLIVVVGTLAVWFGCFLARFDHGKLFADPILHLWLLNALAFVVVPSEIRFPQYSGALRFIPQRLSLFVAIFFCALIAGEKTGRILRCASLILATIFFAFLYSDMRALNVLEVEISSLLRGIPADQRVVIAISDAQARLNGAIHMASGACIGTCFDYANYEPATAQFRIRVRGPNHAVAADVVLVEELEGGVHVVTTEEAPIYSICASAEKGTRMQLRKLAAGETTCKLSLPITPSLF